MALLPCPSGPVEFDTRGNCSASASALQRFIIDQNPNYFVNSGCKVDKKTLGGGYSLHATGRAFDVGIKGALYEFNTGQQLAMAWLCSVLLAPLSCRLGIQRMILGGKGFGGTRVWTVGTDSPLLPFEQWRVCNTCGDHANHLHLELHPDFVEHNSYEDVVEIVREYVGGDADTRANMIAGIENNPRALPPSPLPEPPQGGANLPPSGSTTGSVDGGSLQKTKVNTRSSCEGCGEPYDSTEDTDILCGYACGGSGQYCIIKSGGYICASGTLAGVNLLAFPGPVQDVFPHGSGLIGLSQDGMNIWAVGTTAPVYVPTGPLPVLPPFIEIYPISTSRMIAVHKDNYNRNFYAVYEIEDLGQNCCGS